MARNPSTILVRLPGPCLELFVLSVLAVGSRCAGGNGAANPLAFTAYWCPAPNVGVGVELAELFWSGARIGAYGSRPSSPRELLLLALGDDVRGTPVEYAESRREYGLPARGEAKGGEGNEVERAWGPHPGGMVSDDGLYGCGCRSVAAGNRWEACSAGRDAIYPDVLLGPAK